MEQNKVQNAAATTEPDREEKGLLKKNPKTILYKNDSSKKTFELSAAQGRATCD